MIFLSNKRRPTHMLKIAYSLGKSEGSLPLGGILQAKRDEKIKNLDSKNYTCD